ncbi:MAG: hypothetical protein ACLFPQ_01005 [Candidatus Woesearchaeota archaeon]
MYEDIYSNFQENFIERAKQIHKDFVFVHKEFSLAFKSIRRSEFSDEILRKVYDSSEKWNHLTVELERLKTYAPSVKIKLEGLFTDMPKEILVSEKIKNLGLLQKKDEIKQLIEQMDQKLVNVISLSKKINDFFYATSTEYSKANFHVDSVKNIPKEIENYVKPFDELNQEYVNKIIMLFTEFRYNLNKIAGDIEKIFKNQAQA